MASGRFKIFRCTLPGVEAIESDTSHVFPRHTHEQFGIGVIRRGAQKSLSGRGLVEAGAGDTITVNPGEVHDGAPIGDGGRCWRIVYLAPAVIGEALRDMSEGKRAMQEFCAPVIRDARISRRCGALFAAMTSDALASEERLIALLPDVLGERSDAGAVRIALRAVRRAKELIDDDPAAPHTLAMLAGASGLSRFQLLRQFTRATRLTPHAYLLQRRINLARRLIAQGAGLAEAAAGSGFADQSHMTRIFVRSYGLSPGAYAAALQFPSRQATAAGLS